MIYLMIDTPLSWLSSSDSFPFSVLFLESQVKVADRLQCFVGCTKEYEIRPIVLLLGGNIDEELKNCESKVATLMVHA